MKHSRRRSTRRTSTQYRSGLEDTLAAELKAAGVSFSYETVRVPYVPVQKRNYVPDFITATGLLIEGKGRWTSSDRMKFKLVKQQHPDLDIRLVFSRASQRISKQSKTSYSQWADTHGFPWADGHIPSAWLREPPNIKSLKAIEALHGKSPDARARKAHA